MPNKTLKKITTPIIIFLSTSLIGFFFNFFFSIFPKTQAAIEVLNDKFFFIGRDIEEIKTGQKQIIKYLLEEKNANKRKNIRGND